jgi:hypothetical protein
MVLLAQVALNPAGNPLAPDTPELEIPVAPVVACVIGVAAVLIHNVAVLDGPPVLLINGVPEVLIAAVANPSALPP